MLLATVISNRYSGERAFRMLLEFEEVRRVLNASVFEHHENISDIYLRGEVSARDSARSGIEMS